MVERLDHILIAVEDPDGASQEYASAFGLELESVGESREAAFKTARLSAGNAHIAFVGSTAGSDDSISDFVRDRGQGVYLLAFVVSDVIGEAERLKSLGIKLTVETEPSGRQTVVLDPESTMGVRIQLLQI